MKNLISLGSNCSTRYHIDIYYKSYGKHNESYFFDWLVSSIGDVIKVLSCSDILNEIKECKIIKVKNKKFCNVIFTKFENLVSLHDLPTIYNDNDFKNFIVERYARRYFRLLKAIKTLDNINFIIREKKIEVNLEQLNLLLDILDRYRYGHKLFVVSEKEKISINSRIKRICTNDFKIKECINYSYTEDHIDWLNLIKFLE